MTIVARIVLPAFLLLSVATCGSQASAQKPSGPIQITHGGTYSGNWTSTDAKVAAVTIHTTEPVTIENSTISGRGDLIQFAGGDLTVENVTGRALDPGVKGLQRGSFLATPQFRSLVVRNCSMIGVSFGVKAQGPAQTIEIANNLASDLEDRASDGHGGLLPERPRLGHFVILNHVVAANGAEIAWNQVTQTMGKTSTEDVISIYESQGTQTHPIHVHHNFIQGSSTAVPGKNYTGDALITDGDASATAAPTAYVLFEDNLIIETAGAGIGIDYGHDITARSNRVVSCGVDSSGNRYAWGATAVVLWNFYKSPHFFNNTITGTTGGMVGPAENHTFKPSNEYFVKAGAEDPSNKIAGDDFTNPCLTGGTSNPKAEDAERARWATEVQAAHETIGDRHLARP
jgi:hypothetical protein